MAIASAEQKGEWVFIHDARGRLVRTIAGHDGLQDYTRTTVSIRKGERILVYHVYDENGRLLPAASPQQSQ